jgi:hypothetical protein
VLIIKRFVKLYSESDDVPKRYRNLRKNAHVKTFLKPYPTIPDILVAEYGLDWNDKIIVFHVKEIQRGSWENYRTPFKKVYYGTVRDLGEYLRGYLDRIGKSGRKKGFWYESPPRLKGFYKS